jgi:hypothetical protein
MCHPMLDYHPLIAILNIQHICPVHKQALPPWTPVADPVYTSNPRGIYPASSPEGQRTARHAQVHGNFQVSDHWGDASLWPPAKPLYTE